MGLEDIIYDIVKEFRASKADNQKQIELAKILAKRAYLKFNFEWNTEKNEDVTERQFLITKSELFKKYYQMFLDIAVEIYDVFPEESENLRKMVAGMKACITYWNCKEIHEIGDILANTALNNFKKLDEKK